MGDDKAIAGAILTVSMNPAIDQTVEVDRLRPGQVQRVSASVKHAGGKGVNVAACLADWGLPVAITGVLGRNNQNLFRALFEKRRITETMLRVDGETRVNIKIAETGSLQTTDLNLPGLTLAASHVEEVLHVVETHVRGVLNNGAASPLVIASGSLPGGVTVEFYGKLITLVGRLGGRTVLDTSGPALAAVLQGKGSVMPVCIKPNRAELEQWMGTGLSDVPTVVRTARKLVDKGIPLVVVSLGKEGALFVTAHTAVLAGLSDVKPVSTVGAGDAMVAGIASCLACTTDIPDQETLIAVARRACAFAVAKLAVIGAAIPSREVVMTLEQKTQIDLLDG